MFAVALFVAALHLPPASANCSLDRVTEGCGILGVPPVELKPRLSKKWRIGPSGKPRGSAPDSEPIFNDELIAEIKEGLWSSFAAPFEDLLEKKHESELRNLLDGVSINLSFNWPLNQEVATSGSGSTGSRSGNTPTFNANIKYNPLSYWFFNVNFSRYLDKGLQAPWNGDFVYSFGYDDWHPYTLSLVYSNYGGNRLNADKSKGERFTTFEEGTFALGWKFPVPEQIADWFTLTDDGSISCGVNAGLTPKYTDLASAVQKNWKFVPSINCKYSITGWWYFNWAAFFYPFKQQQPWDPDFTYGFGYFDWHPGEFSLQYNNYSGNRWPWNKSSPGTGRFKDGALSLSWSHVF